MRLNKFIAQNSHLSRREADEAISDGRVYVDDKPVKLGVQTDESSVVKLDGKIINTTQNVYLLVNKPVGYVCSKAQQDDKPTIYELLPPEFQDLRIAGRLDAESHGLVLLTNDGDYANTLMHPRYAKQKVYDVVLERELSEADRKKIETGVDITDGASAFEISGEGKKWRIVMKEGRNRQIRRTFGALQHTVVDLFRRELGPYSIDILGEKVYSTTDKLS